MKKRCLILSHGPVPTPEHTKVEGGGLRCWGLAKGLKQNDPTLAITVAYHDSYRQAKFTDNFEDITITTWEKSQIAELTSQYDSVIVSYSMAELASEVVDVLRPDQQLVLDCYVPIYVEVSARDSNDVAGEYRTFTEDVKRWTHILQRGDLFLCASEAQKKYYEGVLSGVGRINPITYGDDLIMVVPYGIYREPPKANAKPIDKLIGKDAKKYKKILWFGGIYPWFDLRQLVDAVELVNKQTPSKLVIVGAKNPYNTHPDFVRRYDELIEYINSKPAFKDIVVMQDWINFNDRADWYLGSDLVVVMNKLGPENELAWRTRLVDFIWADLPIITNGGDPLGEYLIGHQAAQKFSGESTESMADDMLQALGADQSLSNLKQRVAKVKHNFYWDTVTAGLAADISSHRRAKDLVKVGMYDVQAGQSGFGSSKLKRLVTKAKKVPHYAKKHGYRNTYYAVKGVGQRKLQNVIGRAQTDDSPRMVFISHQLDMSGAPFVLMDMAAELHQAKPDLPVEFVTYMPIHPKNVSRLNKTGIKPRVLLDKNTVPSFHQGDVVVLNTVAHAEPVKEAILSGLESGQVQQLIWYVHEDGPELLFRPDEKTRITKLLKAKKLRFFIAAQKMLKNYQHFFEATDGIEFVTYRHIVDKKYHQTRVASDFSSKLSFSLPGTMGDGRKGQLPIFYAFVQFYKQYYQPNPTAYRDFELVYVGLSTDFLSQQIKNHAAALGKRFKSHGTVTLDECMQIVSGCNITICYSLRECLPLFVFEGMVTGHPILRNDSSGIDEQLQDGVNGYKLDSLDYNQVIDQIETILNKSKTSDAALAKMSKASYKIAAGQEKNSYLPALKQEISYFNGSK